MKHTILIADDSGSMRRSLQDMMNFLGHDTITAYDGKSGLMAFIEGRKSIDRVLTDCDMPAGDGIELIRQIRMLGSEVRICLMSGRLNEALQDLALKAGATSTFYKSDPNLVLLEALDIGKATDPI